MSLSRVFVLFTLLYALFGCKRSVTEPGDAAGFTLVKGGHSGITFSNEVQDQKDFNILTFRNYYNGGGVAIGDINNDGLNDIFFTANMQPNKLYLNQGNFQFEDISQSAGIEGTGYWSTGVAFADVNADGWLDIYVCNSGDLSGGNRENELFINNGGLTFKESAALYGLNDDGYSTHASFFDYDLDGDLDCFVLNNSYTDPKRIAANASGGRNNYGASGGDRLYENVGGKFIDVTEKAGLYSGDIDFGLGVSVGDLNNDLYPDIYVSNDFWERDYLYLNQQDGTFKEVLPDNMSYVSANSMGADIADLNNDGYQDIFSTDMLPASNYRMKSALMIEDYNVEDLKWRNSYFFQYIQNCLQINKGDGTFREMAFFAGVAATDWSWGSLIFDMDNDGRKDIFVSNGIFHDITDLDFVNFLADEDQLKKVVKETGRVDFRDFVEFLPHNKQKNFAFINQGGLRFKNEAEALHLGPESFSNGSAYGDLDNDGDYDLVVNNVNMEAFVYRNNAVEQKSNGFVKFKLKGSENNRFGVGALIKIFYQNQVQVSQVMLSRGFQSSVDPDVIFGVGQWPGVDSAQVIWPDGKYEVLKGLQPNSIIEASYANASGKFADKPKTAGPAFFENSASAFAPVPEHKENKYLDFDHERLMPHVLSREGPKLLHADVNGDKQEDLVLLGAAGQPTQLYLSRNNQYVKSEQPYFEMDKDGEDVCGAFFDADEDGDLDLMLGVGGNEYQRGFDYFASRMYANDGEGNFIRDLVNVPTAIGQIGCIEPCDFDNDGDMDLFIGGRCIPGAYGLTPRSYLFRKDGENVWTDITNEETGPIGMVTDAVWTDVNSDGWPDLVVVGEWMPVTMFVNFSGLLQRDVTIPNSTGWWNVIEAADLDQDGDTDFVVGNWGQNMKFHASPQKPLNIYVNDYDNNGKYEGILEWYFGTDAKPYPFASKMDLTAQLPVLKKNALKYSEYAQKQISDMFSPEVLAQSEQKQVVNFNTSIIRREGKKFVMEPMTYEAQMSPVFGVEIADLDGDDIVDIFLGGNFYGLKPEVGRHDGFSGGYFKGDGKGGFEYISDVTSGIKITGEVKDAVFLNGQLLVARNNAPVLSFKMK
ncbi:MAG: VCBS repeat-containing protein [Lewinellaceae bacterium]|nr:VCBS repeat-containing protein [Phaeodactylibacter sp.]MCB9036390.1 VCBS repeat-containing protein [Lewinellaceae bacterium]